MAKPRFTTFLHDLALVGGHGEGTARGLSWEDFVRHWQAHAKLIGLRPRWNMSTRKMIWLPAWQVPEEWSTATWPDFVDVSRAGKPHDEAVAKPLTLLHMALNDSIKKVPGARDAFDFLLSCGVDPNVYPGHGGSVLATAFSSAHIASMAHLISNGCDLQATLPAGAPSRPAFEQSCLLHRVGVRLARESRVQPGASPYGQGEFSPLHALKLLVEYMPDPMAANAQGVRALDLVLEANPSLKDILMPIWLRRQQQRMAMQMGYEPHTSPDLAQMAQENQGWALAGKAHRDGKPIVFAAPSGEHLEGFSPGPIRLTPLPEGQAGPDAVVVRADKIALSDRELNAEQALAIPQQTKAEAVVCLTPQGESWWIFHPRQMRPALLPTPAPKARPGPGPGRL